MGKIDSDTHTIEGKVINRATSQGLAGVKVEAWPLVTRAKVIIGEDKANAKGRFSISFSKKNLKNIEGDQYPEIFFKVFQDDQLILNTEDTVLWNVGREDKIIKINVETSNGNNGGNMSQEEFSAPIEIPWKLISTTQVLKNPSILHPHGTEPDDTSVAVFYYEPKGESLEENYPDHRLIYLKFTTSISPYKPNDQSFNELALSVLEESLPVWYVLLDLQVEPIPFPPTVATTISPYFLSAAPVRRTMLETGLVGVGEYEGEADALSFGKSASQVHETMSSHATTKTSGGGGGASLNLGFVKLGGGGSTRTTSTAVDSERNVNQYLETTSRDASQERRELLSHTTNAKNILSLLLAKHIGSPYLRFAMWPRPLYVLSADPSDENLWYSQLLHRRSSGIEGIQDFFAVLAVPKTMHGCKLNVKLTRFAVLDNASILPKMIDEEYSTDMANKIEEYLYECYPVGTLIDALDFDITNLPDYETWMMNDKVKKYTQYTPIVKCWRVRAGDDKEENSTGARIITLVIDTLSETPKAIPYKRVEEVWLDVYANEMSRSPLERGVVLNSDLGLTIDLDFTSDRERIVIGNTIPISQPNSIARLDSQKYRRLEETQRNYASEIRRRVTKISNWNILETNLMKEIVSRPVWGQEAAANTSETSGISKFGELILERWANLNLSPEDPKNILLDEDEIKNLFPGNPEDSDDSEPSESLPEELIREGKSDLCSVARAVWHSLQFDRMANRVGRCELAGEIEPSTGVGNKPLHSTVGEPGKSFGSGVKRTSEK